MVDWDDIRFFLAVARGGSLRAGADQLGVTHSTVLRRLAELENTLGVRLFDRLPSGYRVPAGPFHNISRCSRMRSALSRKWRRDKAAKEGGAR